MIYVGDQVRNPPVLQQTQDEKPTKLLEIHENPLKATEGLWSNTHQNLQ